MWLYPGLVGRHFVSVSQKVAKEIKEKFGQRKRGSGSIPKSIEVELR